MALDWQGLRKRFGGNSMKVSLNINAKHFKTPILAILSALFVLAFSRSTVIAIAIALFVSIFTTLAERKSADKRSDEIQSAAPEMIDHLISGLQSGLSLNESLVGLGKRGPRVLLPYFLNFQTDVQESGDFTAALEKVKAQLAQPTTDLIFEAILISKALGGTELMNILRLLGNFIREDLVLRREIATKQNWIKNSAHLSAGAPWILLLLLSTQKSTVDAFSKSTGILILLTGLLLTAIAYLWMNKLARLPEPQRIFVGVQ